MPEAPTSPTFVYAIAWSRRGPTKIGFAEGVAERLSDLQVGCPYRLFVFYAAAPALVPARALEQAAHAKIKGLAMIGEWFNARPSLAKECIIKAAADLETTLTVWQPSPAELKARERQINGTPSDRLAKAVAEYKHLQRDWR